MSNEKYIDYGKLNEALEELPSDLIKDFDEQELMSHLENQAQWMRIRRIIEIAVPIILILIIIFVI